MRISDWSSDVCSSDLLSRIRKTALEWKRPQISESRSRRNCEGRNLRIRLTILEYIKRIIAANPPPPSTRATGTAGISLASGRRNNAATTAKMNRIEMPNNRSTRTEDALFRSEEQTSELQ